MGRGRGEKPFPPLGRVEREGKSIKGGFSDARGDHFSSEKRTSMRRGVAAAALVAALAVAAVAGEEDLEDAGVDVIRGRGEENNSTFFVHENSERHQSLSGFWTLPKLRVSQILARFEIEFCHFFVEKMKR